MKNLLFTLAGIATLALAGCDNDDDDVMNNIEPASTRIELLTTQDWVMLTEEDLNETPLPLRTNQFSRDDIFRFKISGEAVRDEGPTKEEGSPQIVEVARWSFMNEERNLDAGFKSLPINDEIVELSKRKLVLRRIVNGAEKLTTFQAL